MSMRDARASTALSDFIVCLISEDSLLRIAEDTRAFQLVAQVELAPYRDGARFKGLHLRVL